MKKHISENAILKNVERDLSIRLEYYTSENEKLAYKIILSLLV